MFYTSLIFVGSITSKGCQEEDLLPDVTESEVTVSHMDDELLALLEDKSKGKGLTYYMLPDDHDYANIPQDPKNKITSFKVLLGKKLFCEPALATEPKNVISKDAYSCASCHVPKAAFTPGIKQGIGEGGQGFGHHGEGRTINPNYLIDEIDVQPIRTPSIINNAYNRTSIWNGQFGAVGLNEGTEENWVDGKPTGFNQLGFEGVETQAIAGMGVHRMALEKEFALSNYYKDWFDLAFPEVPEEERYTNINAGLAIAAFERTVIADEAPFQKYLRGDKMALTENQKVGATLFFGKANCTNCHDGPALNSEEFFALGMADFEKDTDVLINNEADFEKAKKGRGGFTKAEEDLYKFKTPQLYGLKSMGFYGHGGSFTSVKEIIEYKNKGIVENALVPEKQISEEFKPLGLSEDEINALTDFIENALDDPNMDRFTPKDVASGLCFPNNDITSRTDMGCK